MALFFLKRLKGTSRQARSWISENELHGPHAFLRFVMLAYVQRLNEVTDEFVFKGGNLLWLYIKTPRATVDVDFVTKSLANHEDVRKTLEEVCQKPDGNLQFSIKSFTPVEQQGGLGAAVTIGYVTSLDYLFSGACVFLLSAEIFLARQATQSIDRYQA